MQPLLRWTPIIIALVISGFVAIWPPLKFINLTGPDFGTKLASVVFFSLLIERTVEILISIWRSEESATREAEVQRLIARNVSATEPALVQAQANLIQYKAETLKWTMPIGFALGLLVAALGVRLLSQFVELNCKEFTTGGVALVADQCWWFEFGDIVFTGALLAGGADPIHKLLDLYRKFIEASAAKASGTTQK